MSIKLSIDKFTKFLDRWGYHLSSVYCEGDRIRFVECRTPKYQKTFVVHLPEKYKIMLNGNEDIQKTTITEGESPSTQQISFMTDMKGSITECGIVSISSEVLCAYINNDVTCYYLGDEEEESTNDADEEEEDIIAALERQASKVLKKVDPSSFVSERPERPRRKRKSKKSRKNTDKSGDDKDEKEEEIVKEEGPVAASSSQTKTTNKIKDQNQDDDEGGEEGENLVFEDDNGEPYDEVKDALENPEVDIEDLHGRIQKIDGDDPEGETDDEDDNEDEDLNILRNNIPPELEGEDIFLGIVYVLIEIHTFFKKISTLEPEVLKCYEQIDLNEVEMRRERLLKIRGMCDTFLTASYERLEKIRGDEQDHRLQLIRLTLLFTKMEAQKIKVDANPTKYGEDGFEVKKVYNQIQSTIYDINIEILKLRDSANELLSNYSSSIDEMINM